jgi:hypothetical protein
VLLAAAGCGGGDGQTDPSGVAEITLDNDAVVLDAAGQSRQLTATARDAGGNTVDVAIEWSSSDAGIVTVEGDGLLVAQAPGSAEVTASVGSVSATATVGVSSTATLEVFDGNGQTAPEGQAVPTPPAVRVTDSQDQPVADVRIRFQVATGSGTITDESQETDADGVARVGSWRLGSAGVNTLTAAVEGANAVNEPIEFLATTAEVGGYDITVRYLGEYTSDQLLAFAEAELRWESIVTGDVPDINFNLPANQCGNHPATNGPFDDVTIFVSIEPIDGVGSVLARSGACFIRAAGDLPIIGQVGFDEDDIDALDQEGLLQPTILHEMAHVLGFGTIWDADHRDLVRDPSVPNPTPPLADTHFIGAQAIAAFDDVGGSDYTGAKVPVQNVGELFNVNVHWRDAVFAPELMTGFVHPLPNPLSIVTIASLADLGYTVDVSQADPFTLNPAVRLTGPRRGRELVNDIIPGPIRQVDLNGRIVGVIRP